MTNDNQLISRTGLRPCFAPSIEVLDNLIQRLVESGVSDAAGVHAVEASLLTIRANAAGNTPGLYSALDTVRSAFRAVEDIARRPAAEVLNRAGLLTAAQSHAQSAVGLLVEVLHRAKPNVRSAVRSPGIAVR